MPSEDGRVTLLPNQIRRLAELSTERETAVEVMQYGSVLKINDGHTKLIVNANGDDIDPPNQGQFW
jgi:hypothetical protein